MRTAALLAALLTASACGGSSTVPATPPTDALRIGLQEYEFALSAGALQPGTVTVTVTNVGGTPHDVRLRQGAQVLGASEVLPPGGRQELTVEVADGAPVRLDCTLGGHAAAGMVAELGVGAG